MAGKPMTVPQAIEFLQGLSESEGVMVTSLVVSFDVDADDLPVEEPETNSSFQNEPRRG